MNHNDEQEMTVFYTYKIQFKDIIKSNTVSRRDLEREVTLLFCEKGNNQQKLVLKNPIEIH